MEIQIKQRELKDAIDLAGKVATGHEYWRHVTISTSHEDGVQMLACGPDAMLVYNLWCARVKYDGIYSTELAPFKRLVNNAPKVPLTLSVEDGVCWMDTGHAKLRLAPETKRADWVAPELGERIGRFTGDEWREILATVGPAVAVDTARPILNAFWMTFHGGTDARVVAADGFRLALWERSRCEAYDASLLVVGQPLIKCQRAFKDVEIVRVYENEARQAVFDTDQFTLFVRQESGKFPDYTQVIPADNKINAWIDIDRAHWLEVLRQLAPLADENANTVELYIDSDGARHVVYKNSIVAAKAGLVYQKRSGLNVRTAFNYRYLQDFLKTRSEQWIRVGFSTREQAFGPNINGPIRFMTGNQAEACIMPMHTHR